MILPKYRQNVGCYAGFVYDIAPSSKCIGVFAIATAFRDNVGTTNPWEACVLLTFCPVYE